LKKQLIKKVLALAIIVVFVSVSFQPIIAENTLSVGKESDYSNVDFEKAKEYLFQTLIDISNNPEVKEFLNEHKHDLITRNDNNYDCKDAIQKIYSQNPKLLKSILFTKPEMTYEYLEKNYNKGLELVNILGEKESLKIVESVKIANLELSNELKDIILNDKELSKRVSVLEEMNKNLISNTGFLNYPIICLIVLIISSPFAFLIYFFESLWGWANIHNKPLFSLLFAIFTYLFLFTFSPFASLIFIFCLY